MKNLNWCIYTYRHRRAFEYCVNKLIHDPNLKEEMLKRARIHDMDKMVMYLFLEQKEAQKIHMMHQPHHLENSLPRTYEDLVETIIDYECAPYTKPDKPLNAYDFTNLLMQMKVLDGKTGQISSPSWKASESPARLRTRETRKDMPTWSSSPLSRRI